MLLKEFCENLGIQISKGLENILGIKVANNRETQQAEGPRNPIESYKEEEKKETQIDKYLSPKNQASDFGRKAKA